MKPKSPMRPANAAGQAAVPPSNSYSPSVPISLYREVAAELQATKATIEALKNQNQQLTQQNQQLRQEIEKAVQSALQLRQAANGMPAIEIVETPLPQPRQAIMPDLEPNFQIPVMPRPIVMSEIEPTTPLLDPELVIEQDSKPRRKIRLEKESSSELGGWWLGLAIALIVVTAFGAGFMIVRPLLPSSK